MGSEWVQSGFRGVGSEWVGNCLLCNDFAVQTFFVESVLVSFESIQEELVLSVAKKVVVISLTNK